MPDDIGPLEELARLYAKLERMEDAALVLSKLTRLDSWNSQNWLWLARAYFALGDYEKSENVLQEAWKIFPEDASILRERDYVRVKMKETDKSYLMQSDKQSCGESPPQTGRKND